MGEGGRKEDLVYNTPRPLGGKLLVGATPVTPVTPVQAAQGLNDQGDKLNKIVDDLNEIEFTMKKATKVIRDITRGLLTDK